jgi:hypothetical protein
MSSFSPTSALCTACLVLGWWLYWFRLDRKNNPKRLPLPPGPNGYPIIDNLLDMPMTRPWLVYDKWTKIYGMLHQMHFTCLLALQEFAGDMVYFKVLGQSFLVLGSLETIYDLFEKRSSNYSDRGRLPMLNELYVLFYLIV